MSGRSPMMALNNGVKMPALGLGVCQSSFEQTAHVVETAIASGYRLIDTAAAYFNEQQVGEGIRRSGIDRAEIFVTTKLWISDYGYESALRAFDVSQSKLGLDYVDLYLLHWPVPLDFEGTVASYRAAEKLLADGRVRAIGVCNFGAKHLEDLIARTCVVPAVNQVELHHFYIQRELREAQRRLGIVIQARWPIGGVKRYWSGERNAIQDPLVHPVVVELAAKYGKTPAQIVLRWHMDCGLSVIPKSVRPERIAENIDIFDFVLTPEEIAAIDFGVRGGPDPEVIDTEQFSARIEA